MSPIFVIVFWMKIAAVGAGVTAVDFDSMEFGGYAKDPSVCASLPMADILTPLHDAASKIEAGLVPRVVCGLAAPDQQVVLELPKNKPPVRSEPGHPDQPQGPSGPL